MGDRRRRPGCRDRRNSHHSSVYITKSASSGTGGASGGATSSAAPSDVASANDKDPVAIITDDPSCAPWGPITTTLADIENNGWLDRNPAIPAAGWSPQAKAQYEAVGAAMRKAADQTVPLAKMTPHRVMRELYSQFIAYSRAYPDSLATYQPKDDFLGRAGSTASLVLTDICDSIKSGSAAARASLIPKPKAPTSFAPIGDLANPKPIFDTPDAVCANLSPTLQQLLANPDFKNWVNTDANIPGSKWSNEQRSLTTIVFAVMSSTALAIEKLAAESTNPMVQDFLLLGVQYRRTYIATEPNYLPNDHDLYSAGQMAPGVVSSVCKYFAG